MAPPALGGAFFVWSLVDDACTDLCRSSVCTLAAMSSFCGCYVHGFVAKTPLFTFMNFSYIILGIKLHSRAGSAVV